ncbi:hypothetical protein RhiirA5_440079 [Rhizophagus irregularis]|uniref:Zn-finger domain-containing protein n=1 Tax=Rhizophagus irregularis TaxID=588596 RepID=A0A2N0NH57_9GLOM|nr:hypothetical protein RhiirA5_440079 [Rhizophagus irregularis]
MWLNGRLNGYDYNRCHPNCDIESEENNENNFEESDECESDIDETINETIEAEEEFIFNFENIPNFILYNPESDQTTVIDIRPISVNCNTLQFPDTAYAEFMELVLTHHLSNSAGNSVLKWFRKHYLRNDVILPTNVKQGHNFIYSMNIEHLSYLKTKVLEYEDEEYYLYHRPIFDAVKELLSNADILKHCKWEFIAEYNEQHERIYGEQWTGLWWKRAQNSLGTTGFKKILSIILYSDATTLDHLGKSSEHPVYLSLGNIPIWRRNKRDAKVLLGILPKLKSHHNRKNNKANFISAKRILYQHCFDIMTEPIFKSNGLDIKMNNQIIWAFPFLSEFIGDLPEDAALTLTYNSSRCKRPCHICIITINDLNNPNFPQSQIELRTPYNMQFILNENYCHEYSIHPMRNIFWKFW